MEDLSQIIITVVTAILGTIVLAAILVQTANPSKHKRDPQD